MAIPGDSARAAPAASIFASVLEKLGVAAEMKPKTRGPSLNVNRSPASFCPQTEKISRPVDMSTGGARPAVPGAKCGPTSHALLSRKIGETLAFISIH